MTNSENEASDPEVDGTPPMDSWGSQANGSVEAPVNVGDPTETNTSVMDSQNNGGEEGTEVGDLGPQNSSAGGTGSQENQVEEEERCAVCMSHFEAPVLVVGVGCGHVFCYPCLCSKYLKLR